MRVAGRYSGNGRRAFLAAAAPKALWQEVQRCHTCACSYLYGRPTAIPSTSFIHTCADHFVARSASPCERRADDRGAVQPDISDLVVFTLNRCAFCTGSSMWPRLASASTLPLTLCSSAQFRGRVLDCHCCLLRVHDLSDRDPASRPTRSDRAAAVQHNARTHSGPPSTRAAQIVVRHSRSIVLPPVDECNVEFITGSLPV